MLYRLEDGSGLIPALVGVQRQVVIRYATAAARSAELKAPTLGMVTFRDDAKAFEWWDGLSWVSLDRRQALAYRSSLAGLPTSSGTPVVQASLGIPAVGWVRAVQAFLTVFGYSTGDASAVFFADLKVAGVTGVDSSAQYLQRDPITTSPQLVNTSSLFTLPAGTAVTITAETRRSAGPSSTFNISNPSSLNVNRLEALVM